MTLSDQALGAVMMALQKSLLEQTDIVPVLKEFNFQVDDNEELIVANPPIVRVDERHASDEYGSSFIECKPRTVSRMDLSSHADKHNGYHEWQGLHLLLASQVL